MSIGPITVNEHGCWVDAGQKWCKPLKKCINPPAYSRKFQMKKCGWNTPKETTNKRPMTPVLVPPKPVPTVTPVNNPDSDSEDCPAWIKMWNSLVSFRETNGLPLTGLQNSKDIYCSRKIDNSLQM